MSKAKERTATKTVRCAVYTRKSSEEGLDQEFNSLDAQRDAAEAYITSQKAEGWVCLPDQYDDGGFTGGNMDRPALHRLMMDIEAGKIDCVVVYKVDRLSRSLLDFAKIMETFEKRNVAFVSVTQQFNTSTPMGRLILNVLLSFAQFERELIGERIRDKIAAQCRRGRWTGGVPVLGYDVDRSGTSPRLIVNAEEAARVQAIFNMYLKFGSLLAVVDELDHRGWRNKIWTSKKGAIKGGGLFGKASLSFLLRNPIYIAKIKHRKQLYDGQHEPIIETEIFRKVQRQLEYNGRSGGIAIRNKYGALLRGLLRCKTCSRTMVHTYTGRGSKRYRYYTCTRAIHNGRSRCPSGSLPAIQIEQIVVGQIRGISKDVGLREEVHRQAQSQVEMELAELKTEQKQLKRELGWRHAEIKKLAVAGGTNGETAECLADMQRQADGIEARLKELQGRMKDVSADRLERAEVDAAFADFDTVWNSLIPREQAQLLALVVASVQFDGEAGRIATTFHPTGIKALAQDKLGGAA